MFHISYSDTENLSSPNSAGPVYLTIKLYFGFYQLHELTKNNASHIVDQTLIQLKKKGKKERMEEGEIEGRKEASESHMQKTTKHKSKWDFPENPVVKTPYFHCRGHSLNPWLGN